MFLAENHDQKEADIMSLEAFREFLSKSKNTVFFGGAGVSTESGVPDFRSETGIYSSSGYDFPPEVMLSHNFFISHPKEFYHFYFDKLVYPDAKPNSAHKSLAALEEKGRLSAVITQNVDGLHQQAGSKNVIELHGSVHRNHCTRCGKTFDLAYMLRYRDSLPICDECGSMIKPDIVLYGEPLDENVINRAVESIEQADLLIVGGTSLAVYPAAGFLSCFHGSALVLINRDSTDYDSKATLVFRESIGKILSAVY